MVQVQDTSTVGTILGPLSRAHVPSLCMTVPLKCTQVLQLVSQRGVITSCLKWLHLPSPASQSRLLIIREALLQNISKSTIASKSMKRTNKLACCQRTQNCGKLLKNVEVMFLARAGAANSFHSLPEGSLCCRASTHMSYQQLLTSKVDFGCLFSWWSFSCCSLLCTKQDRNRTQQHVGAMLLYSTMNRLAAGLQS
jgi:hypothetical protein